jgi:altronate hydrolase
VVGGLHQPQRRRDEQQPFPGNKAGGLTTILEKSLGAAAKGGTTNLVDVYQVRRADSRQGLRVHGLAGLRPGLRHRPGGGGGNIICFTTGRGSAFGFKPVPSIKLATNTAMYQKLSETWTSIAARS